MNFDLKTSILSGANLHSSNVELHKEQTQAKYGRHMLIHHGDEVHSETKCQVNDDILHLRSSCSKDSSYKGFEWYMLSSMSCHVRVTTH